jgi:hypothetical protein
MRNKLFNFLVGTTLTLGVLGFLPDAPGFRAGKFVLMDISIIVFLSVYFIKNVWLRMFILWNVACFFVFMYSGMIKASPGDVHLWMINVLIALKFFVFLLVFYEVLKDKIIPKTLHPILNIICVIGILQVIMMILQASGVWCTILPAINSFKVKSVFFKETKFLTLIARPFLAVPTGFLSNPNMASSLLALCFPAFLRRKWCWFIPLIFVGLGLSKSLGGIIPVLIVSLAWVFIYRRTWFWPVIACVAAGLVGYIWRFDKVSQILDGSGRFPVWKVVVTKFIKLKPFMGYGFGRGATLWKEIFLATGIEAKFLHPHNEYLSVAVETGLVGLAFIIGFIVDVFKKSVKLAKRNYIFVIVTLGIFTGLFNSGVNFLMHTTTGLILVVYLAMAEKNYKLIQPLNKRSLA